MTLLRNQDIQTLHHFKDISLSEMDSVKLMNRTDTKFVFKRALLSDLLVELKSKYQVLNIEGHLISYYKTLYFDTKDFRLYQDHHNKKGIGLKWGFGIMSNRNSISLKSKINTKDEQLKIGLHSRILNLN